MSIRRSQFPIRISELSGRTGRIEKVEKSYPSAAPEKKNFPSLLTSLFSQNSRNLRDLLFLLLVTALMVMLAWFGYLRFPTNYVFQYRDLIQFIHDPFWLGHSLQTTLVPIALLYGLSQTRLFQRVISREMSRVDVVDFTAILILFQLLAMGFEMIITHSRAVGQTIGVILQAPGYVLLIPIVGSLLFGWKVGLILGLETWLVRGTYDLLFRLPPFDFYRLEDFAGLLSAFSWKDILLNGYLFNTWAISPVWVGMVTGVVGRRMDRRRFSPIFLIALIPVIFISAGLLTMVGRGNYSVIEWLPSTLTAGLGLLFAGLMIGNAQSSLAQRKAEAAELAAARAELKALRAQISPHFLFNALNTIRYFIRTDPSTARQLLLDLSQILQRSLRSEQFAPLQDELDYVRAYLALEKARFNERLQINWNLDVDKYMDCPVPVLILQPIVENAVTHGISPKPDGGQVSISVACENRNLVLTVEDNGIGMEPEKLNSLFLPQPANSGRESIGMRNVDGRLRALYGDRHALSIRSEVGKGTFVQFTIPVEKKMKE
jgi:signal transduction histidine kinase